MPGKSSAVEMPRLDAFDQEFGREPVAIARGHRRKIKLKVWVLICGLLGVGVIGALALGWPNGEGLSRFELQSAAPLVERTATRDEADEQIDRLRREVDALKQEISELNEAQRQSGETIAALQSAEQETPAPVPGGHWYSIPAALQFGIAAQSQPRAAAPPPRRPAARPEPREPARRDNGGNGNGGAPLSLEAPQQ
jgi:TolA-binding protein